MKKILFTTSFLLIFCISFSFTASAQIKISGSITDSTTHENLVGVSIQIVNTAIGVVTGENGNFNLLSARALPFSIQISRTGYNNRVIEINQAITTLQIALVVDNKQLPDLTVSANKRGQTAQRVAMSITTLSPVELKRTNANEFRDFASGIPNLSFSTQGNGNSGRFDNGIAIRGIAGRNTTALYLDETALPENISPRLEDISRVEILKGPQGTLYGSRNMGGAVKIITNTPNVKKIEGSMSTNYAFVKEGAGDYGIDGVLNLPLSKTIALRVNGFYDYQTGVFDKVINKNANILNGSSTIETAFPDGSPFIINADACPSCNLNDQQNVDDEMNYGFSAAIGFYPTPKISIIPKIILQNQSGTGYDFAEGSVNNFTQYRASGVPESFKDYWKFYSLTAGFDLGNGKIISSTSYLDRDIKETEDAGEAFSETFLGYDGADYLDFFGGQLFKHGINKQFTQELRYQSNYKGKLDFTAGLFYRNSDDKQIWRSTVGGFNAYTALNVFGDVDFAVDLNDNPISTYDFDGAYKTQEFALFGEVYYKITNNLKATFGLRYFDATNSILSAEDGFLSDLTGSQIIGSQREKGINPKFNLTYEIDKTKLLYATVAKGFRLGNLNDVVSEVFCADELAELPGGTYPKAYKSDYLWNYEMGFKSTWLNGKLILNASVFYNDWKRLQQEKVFMCGYSFITNVGKAHTAGFELETRARPIKGLDISMGMGVVDATLDESGLNLDGQKGDKILFTPSFTSNGHVQYSWDVNNNTNCYIRADLQFAGKRLNTFSPEDPAEVYNIFPAYTIIDTRAGLSYKKYELSFFVDNLSNTHANYGIARAFGGEVAGRPRFATNRPITIGIDFAINF